MTSTPPHLDPHGLVAVLRAAGCVFAEDEAQILASAAGSEDELAALLARRVAGEPLEVVVGWADFGGHRIVVEPGVFVPRRRTLLLAECALEVLRGLASARPLQVAELCCGTGAVAVALQSALPGLYLQLVDVSPAAVRCARRNVGPGAQVSCGDLYDPLPTQLAGRLDLVVANAPYVPSDELGLLPPEARDHEPSVALDGGPDGLDVLRRVVAGADRWLAPAGQLLMETSRQQLPALHAVARAAGLVPATRTSDDLGATVVCCRRQR